MKSMTFFEYLESKYDREHDSSAESAVDFIDWCETFLLQSPPVDVRLSGGQLCIIMADLTIVAMVQAVTLSAQDTSIPITGLSENQDGRSGSPAIPI